MLPGSRSTAPWPSAVGDDLDRGGEVEADRKGSVALPRARLARGQQQVLAAHVAPVDADSADRAAVDRPKRRT